MDLPERARVRLAEKIIESIDNYAALELEAPWDREVGRRVKEIQSRAETGIAAEEVMTSARRALDETRKVSSTRRR